MSRRRRMTADQLEAWSCTCGATYTVEPTSEVIHTRHHGARRVVRFYPAAAAAAAAAVTRCEGCGQALHFVYNHQGPNGRPLRSAYDPR
jgi:hypothetical protein